MSTNTDNINKETAVLYNGIKLQFPNLEYKKLQEKKCRQFNHIIRNSRLGKKMRFSTYGAMRVHDNGMSVDIIETQTEFKRSNTMCMVYDILQHEKYGYDKLFLFMHTAGESSYFDYIVYNTKSRKSVCHFYKSPDISAVQDINQPSSTLLTDLNVSFNRMESTSRYIK